MKISTIVAPFTGAWIEIPLAGHHLVPCAVVAPFTGAWIEIILKEIKRERRKRRSLHGGVD